MEEAGYLGLVHLVASLLNTIVRANRWPWLGRIVNALALGFGAAKPDPERNE